MDIDLLNRAVICAFSEPVTIIRDGSDATEIEVQGIFDSRHFEIDAGGEVAVSELVTTLAIAEDPGNLVAVGERLIARGVTYRMKDRRPDGQGMTVLELERA